MLDNLKKYEIILASNSPRRKELLAGLDIPFEVKCIPGIDESYPDDLPLERVAEYISCQKANAYKQFMKSNQLIITADTVVLCNNRIIGKPQDRQDAASILQLLSGQTHCVITGVTILDKDKDLSFSTTSHVKFATLSTEEINYYIDNYAPYDKAGAYGIQEWIGFIAVESIAGSYFNIMGLPVQRLYRILKNWP